MTTKKLTKLLALYLPYILLGLVATNLGEAWRLAEGKELGEHIMSMMGTFPVAFANPLPSLHPLDLLIGFSCGTGLRLAVYLRSKNAKKYRHGMEYGSARWGNAKDIEPFMAPKFSDNIILTKTERLMMSNRPPDPKNARNKNVLVVGGSGSGKTRFWLKPNLLQCHSSYVVTDPKGSIVVECGNALLKNGYKLKILNTINFSKSMHYNPFAYVHSEKDILKLVTTLMTNTKGDGSGGDPFWEKSERLLLTALIAYLHYEAPVEEQNFATLLEMLNTMQVLEDDEEYQNPVDLLFEELAKKKPDHPAVKAYQRYRGGPDETIRSVIMTVNARMQPFDNEELLEIFSSNDIPLDEFGTGIDGDKKTKSNLFIIIPDDDDTFNFVPGMVYTLLFQELYRQARFFGGKLPMDVGFWLDEMANIKMPNNFDKILATCRSRGVYCVPILQSLAQLKTLFADGAWEGIVGNCDTFIYLGGNEASTYEYVSKLLGKWTIDKRTSGESKGSSGSYSQNYDVLGRELMLEYELRLLPDDECIIFVRGENPIRDKKWFPWEHEQYLEARKCGAFNPKEQQEKQEKRMEECEFLGEESLNYLKLQKDKNENIRLYELDAFSFMMMDLDEMEKKIHSTPNDKKGKAGAPTITAGMIQSALHAEKEREEAERKAWFVENFDSLTLLDIYASEWIGEIRRNVIRDLLQAEAPEEVIKSIIRPEIEEGQVLQKKKMWMEMEGRERIEE